MAPILLSNDGNPTGQSETALPMRTIEAEPEPVAVDTGRAALVIIDMQRDFLEPGGFGAALGNDFRVSWPMSRHARMCSRPRGAPVFSSSTPAKATGPTSRMRLRLKSNGEILHCASVLRAPWAAYSCAVSRDTTSSRSFIRLP